MRSVVLAALLTLGFSSGAFAASGDPAAATKAFYDAYMALHVSGLPDDKMRAKFAPFISPALEKLLADAGAAEEAHFKRTKNAEPPLVEGDAFTSLFEGATSYEVGNCIGKADKAACDVALTYADNSGDKPTHWTDKALLVKTEGGWVLDDIIFGGTWDFGNHGHMQDLLRQVIRDAAE